MTLFFRTMLDYEELASTSDTARELVEAGEVELPLLARARRQTSGRGRGEHHWWSDEGSLTFTIAIDPAAYDLRRDHEPRVALAVAVGLIDVVEEISSSHLGQGAGSLDALEIRWPNDVEMRGRKVAGILPERIEGRSGARLLIGIGLNVTTDLSGAPAEIRRMATTLRDWNPIAWDLDQLLAAFLERFPLLLTRLAQDDPRLASSWAARDVLKGELVRISLGTEVHTGRGGGIDPTGGFRLVGDAGIRTYHGGQILRLP
ncbi:MAG: birA, biotin-(acetyl-CoA-carboxylase) ligase [Planctomycetota bacterium]|nr:birA, biotin-(acetyl-CoA-carboxylase) ligase [Planctomycetota bacterium]